MGKQRKIEIGKTYERLTVTEYLGIKPYNGRNHHTYRCICKCGNTIDLPGPHIGRGWKSCGCLQWESREKEIQPGSKFGKLQVIKKEGKVDNRGYLYRCRCSCGKEVLIRSDNLRSGETKSCGCLRETTLRKNSKKAYEKIFVDGTNIARIDPKNNKLQKNNTSGVKGVRWHKRLSKWQASIGFKGKTYHIGYYDTIIKAKEAREKAEQELYGKFLSEIKEKEKPCQ